RRGVRGARPRVLDAARLFDFAREVERLARVRVEHLELRGRARAPRAHDLVVHRHASELGHYPVALLAEDPPHDEPSGRFRIGAAHELAETRCAEAPEDEQVARLERRHDRYAEKPVVARHRPETEARQPKEPDEAPDEERHPNDDLDEGPHPTVDDSRKRGPATRPRSRPRGAPRRGSIR